jgi:hypothetical protein
MGVGRRVFLVAMERETGREARVSNQASSSFAGSASSPAAAASELPSRTSLNNALHERQHFKHVA